MNKKIVVVAGATACGKSALAVDLAEALNSEVVSCDSMQIYRRMNIGTAKIAAAETRGVPHRMLDIVEPDAEYSAGAFAQAAEAAIGAVHARGKIPVLAGGTGLYLDAVLYPLSFFSDKDNAVRTRLRQEWARDGAEAMHERLRKIDAAESEKIHPNNTKRLLRALEIHELTGSCKSARDERRELRYDVLLLVLNPPRQTLYERIEARVDAMFAAGLTAEVERLLASGVTFADQAMQAIGYKEFQPFFAGESDLETVKDQIKIHTRHYAKRQISWLRRYPFAVWLSEGAPRTRALELTRRFAEDRGE